MDTFELVRKKFEAMGARVKMSYVTDHGTDSWRILDSLSIDVGADRKGEFFDLTLWGNPVEIQVVDCRPRDRHLLLLVKAGETLASLADRNNWAKLLCGHDERHWFVAGVDPVAADVARAKDLLKPAGVIVSQNRCGIRAKNRNRRKNAAWIRQGEWFFVPVEALNLDSGLIFKNEPLLRGWGSKPHMVEQILRRGGVQVYVCRQFPDGLTAYQYSQLISKSPEAKKLPWQNMAREPEVYARGHVRHPDHKTVVLNGWHRVYVSDEKSSFAFVGNAFLD